MAPASMRTAAAAAEKTTTFTVERATEETATEKAVTSVSTKTLKPVEQIVGKSVHSDYNFGKTTYLFDFDKSSHKYLKGLATLVHWVAAVLTLGTLTLAEASVAAIIYGAKEFLHARDLRVALNDAMDAKEEFGAEVDGLPVKGNLLAAEMVINEGASTKSNNIVTTSRKDHTKVVNDLQKTAGSYVRTLERFVRTHMGNTSQQSMHVEGSRELLEQFMDDMLDNRFGDNKTATHHFREDALIVFDRLTGEGVYDKMVTKHQEVAAAKLEKATDKTNNKIRKDLVKLVKKTDGNVKRSDLEALAAKRGISVDDILSVITDAINNPDDTAHGIVDTLKAATDSRLDTFVAEFDPATLAEKFTALEQSQIDQLNPENLAKLEGLLAEREKLLAELNTLTTDAKSPRVSGAQERFIRLVQREINDSSTNKIDVNRHLKGGIDADKEFYNHYHKLIATTLESLEANKVALTVMTKQLEENLSFLVGGGTVLQNRFFREQAQSFATKIGSEEYLTHKGSFQALKFDSQGASQMIERKGESKSELEQNRVFALANHVNRLLGGLDSLDHPVFSTENMNNEVLKAIHEALGSNNTETDKFLADLYQKAVAENVIRPITKGKSDAERGLLLFRGTYNNGSTKAFDKHNIFFFIMKEMEALDARLNAERV